MYEQQTKKAILQRMLDASPPDIDRRPGSVTFDLLSPAAIELAQAYIELDNVLRSGFASTEQPSRYLDLRAAEMGLSRLASVKAEGRVTFTAPKGTIVPAGTVVSTDDAAPVFYVTTEPAVLESGTATVGAEAREGGASGNVAGGRIRLILGDLTGIVSVANEYPFKNGSDAESDEALLQRYYDRVRRPATSGNAWHYRQWAMEVKGVGDVKVFPVWNGNGTVKLALLSSDKRAPSDETVNNVRAAVKERRPVGACVTVVPAEEDTVDVSAKLKLEPGADLEEVKARFAANLQAYLADLAFREPVVRYIRVLGLLLGINSVVDFSDLTLNGGEENLTVPGDHVAVVGTVNFSVT